MIQGYDPRAETKPSLGQRLIEAEGALVFGTLAVAGMTAGLGHVGYGRIRNAISRLRGVEPAEPASLRLQDPTEYTDDNETTYSFQMGDWSPDARTSYDVLPSDITDAAQRTLVETRKAAREKTGRYTPQSPSEASIREARNRITGPRLNDRLKVGD